MADSIDMSKQTGRAMHPKLKNLGTFAHPMGGYSKTGDFPDFKPKSVEKKKVLNETKAPQTRGQAGSAGVGEDYADFKPKVRPKANTRMTQKQVSDQLQNGGANANLASFGDASYDTSPFVQKPTPVIKPKSKVKKSSAGNFFGKLSGF